MLASVGVPRATKMIYDCLSRAKIMFEIELEMVRIVETDTCYFFVKFQVIPFSQLLKMKIF